MRGTLLLLLGGGLSGLTPVNAGQLCRATNLARLANCRPTCLSSAWKHAVNFHVLGEPGRRWLASWCQPCWGPRSRSRCVSCAVPKRRSRPGSTLPCCQSHLRSSCAWASGCSRAPEGSFLAGRAPQRRGRRLSCSGKRQSCCFLSFGWLLLNRAARPLSPPAQISPLPLTKLQESAWGVQPLSFSVRAKGTGTCSAA